MSYHLRVKICGITVPADARQAALLGADAIGLNFYPKSKRHIDPSLADPILRVLPPFVEAVGVFVETALRDIFPVLNALPRIRTCQVYGSKREMSDTYPFHFIPAFPVKDQASLLDITRYLDACRAINRLPSAILVDAHAPKEHGGTGRAIPWALLSEFRPGVPLILAGGLRPDNVAEAIRIVRPYGVDVASGVEASPGFKDAEKMRRFIDNARAAAAKYRPAYG